MAQASDRSWPESADSTTQDRKNHYSMSEAMTEIEVKRLESRLRGRAARRGYQVKKSRSRTWEHPGFGTYCLVNDHNCIELGDRDTGFGISLEEIEEYLSDTPALRLPRWR
ncbi:MAG: hypothetical protein AB9869_28575 [Verrucomicrobiia bacterium]